MSGKSLDINALDDSALEALLEQARMVQANRKEGHKAQYAESITDFVTLVVANEEQAQSKPDSKSAWVGYTVRGITVVVDGHAFTVSVTVTDTERKAALQEERELAAAEALLAKRAVKA